MEATIEVEVTIKTRVRCSDDGTVLEAWGAERSELARAATEQTTAAARARRVKTATRSRIDEGLVRVHPAHSSSFVRYYRMVRMTKHHIVLRSADQQREEKFQRRGGHALHGDPFHRASIERGDLAALNAAHGKK